SLDLQYVKEGSSEEDNHYHLAYTPVYNENPFSFLNANTGEWNNPVELGESEKVAHPWAEDELNYLVESRILDVDDVSKFNPNADLTKGEAIEIIMKSLTHFYDGNYPGQENAKQSFENIGPDHPLFH